MNKHARALGRLGKGRKKTMSPAAIQQRRNAAKSSMRKKYSQGKNKIGHESVSGV